MRVKLFTFRYSATLGGFDDGPLLAFSRDREVVSFREHFYLVNDVPHLTCVLIWQDAVVTTPRDPAADASRGGSANRKPKPDPLAGLDEPQRLLFNTLRDWRAEQAREEGVPPYVLFNNRQLAEIVRSRPDHSAGLAHIAGIGPAKVERYGEAVVRIVQGDAPAKKVQGT